LQAHKLEQLVVRGGREQWFEVVTDPPILHDHEQSLELIIQANAWMAATTGPVAGAPLEIGLFRLGPASGELDHIDVTELQ